jgi:hypothetical protein
VVRGLVPDDLTLPQRVRLGAVLLGIGHVALLGWALLQAWFYADDFQFLDEALDTGPSPSFLLEPHDSQLMPVGRAITWLVSRGSAFDWVLAAGITLLVQVLAAVACYVMLRTLFGERPAILLPLGLYLFSPMAIEAKLWWSAALNAGPMQVAFFVLVTGLVRWSRHRTLGAALLSLAGLALAVLSGPRGLVMILPSGVLLTLFLTAGPWWRRPWRVVVENIRLLGPLAAVGIVYLVGYRTSTPSPVATEGTAPAWAILRKLVGTNWLTSAVGGPWRWSLDNPPLSTPDPPVVLHATAAVVVVVVLGLAMRRRAAATAAALAVLGVQLAATYVALVVGRGVQLGSDVGLVSRYLADSLPVTALALGLAIMPVAGSSVAVTTPRLTRAGTVALAVACGAFMLGSVVSTVSYARLWSSDDPARAFVANARSTIAADPSVIADVGVPEEVRTALSAPGNLPSRLLAPLGDDVRTATRGNDLKALDDSGVQRPAVVAASVAADPGPVPDCGYRVASDPVEIHVDPRDVIPFWWTSIGYLASGDGEVEVLVDGRAVDPIEVQAGLHTWFFTGEGPFETVTLRSLTPNLTICVNPLQSGNLEALP